MQNFSLDQLWGMKCSKLKEILRENNKSASGTKQILVARCYALILVDDREITADERSDRDTGIEDRLHHRTEKDSCTSKLNGWIVPRNLTVKPKPLKDMKVKKIMFGKQDVSERPTVNTFEPRAPQDRTLDTYALRRLYDNLEEHAPNSSFFLYHDSPLTYEDENHDFADSIESTNVAMNTSVSATVNLEAFTEKAVVPPKTLPIPLIQVDNEIQDDIEIDQSFIAKFVKQTTDDTSCTLSDEQIQQVEQLTKGQSDNSLWKQIHRFKETASNFGKMIKCSRNPDGLLKAMFYSEPHL
ncbi:unnamed protein product [Mytilus coruscus]|uniref:SAP domain-containing protein n=1 Tax=Mytilus coruscus TaxID=42192 RepID=A0A6J8DSG2_MYTCO|nr:unnamed protein product [Mytilus coruscus]